MAKVVAGSREKLATIKKSGYEAALADMFTKAQEVETGGQLQDQVAALAVALLDERNETKSEAYKFFVEAAGDTEF